MDFKDAQQWNTPRKIRKTIMCMSARERECILGEKERLGRERERKSGRVGRESERES